MIPYIDRYETCKIVIAPNNDARILKREIREALHFELIYLELKSEYYDGMAKEDVIRMKRLSKQIEDVDDI